MYLPVFMQRFKKVNKYNIRYAIFPELALSRKWPAPKSLGKCKIINDIEECSGEYVDVQMLDSGEIHRNVVLTDNKRKVYKLQEICHVKYII